jgi:hypothetical protein
MGIWVQKKDGNLYGVSGNAHDITKVYSFEDSEHRCSVVRSGIVVASYTAETESEAVAKAQQWIDWLVTKINQGGVGEVIIDDSDF